MSVYFFLGWRLELGVIDRGKEGSGLFGLGFFLGLGVWWWGGLGL